MSLARYVGKAVILKEDVPADRRGEWVAKGTRLIVEAVYGQHVALSWPDRRPATARLVHYSKLKTG